MLFIGIGYYLGKSILERKQASLNAQIKIDKVASTAKVSDSLRGMQTIKAMGIASLIYNQWQNQHQKQLLSISENIAQLQKNNGLFNCLNMRLKLV